MIRYFLRLTLLSDATFASGDGVSGLVDREVEHDGLGLPFLRGRTLKGLLSEEADNLLHHLRQIGPLANKWTAARSTLFGQSGGTLGATPMVNYGHAVLPETLRQTVAQTFAARDNHLTPQDVLSTLTAIRRQTAITADGVPVDGSLRAMRVILRQTTFTAPLSCQQELTNTELGLLAAAILAFRRAGTGRNRGRGRVQADLLDNQGKTILWEAYQTFVQEAGL
jgi:hypothetical protein